MDPLSARQTEIAGLVVRGKSSREIAAELFLSPRTVENHIAAIFNKLGVGSRAELISALWSANRGDGGNLPSAVSRAAQTNLPTARTSLLARESEIADIAHAFADGRLVTVTGAGGVGKTRAALAVGEALLDEMQAGVWLTPLAPIASGAFVAAAVAQSLNIAESPKLPLLETLVAYLVQKRLLLILDNCEHVIGAAAALADGLLSECPQLRILATSREPLRIPGEQAYRLPSLSIPGRQDARELTADVAALMPPWRSSRSARTPPTAGSR